VRLIWNPATVQSVYGDFHSFPPTILVSGTRWENPVAGLSTGSIRISGGAGSLRGYRSRRGVNTPETLMLPDQCLRGVEDRRRPALHGHPE
jgi:hypothetical protein